MDSMRKKKPLLQHHHHNKIPEEFLMENHHIKIPEEILKEEILPRLPVKSLLRFRCVSKPWLSLIDSDRFIKTHLQNSTLNPDYSHWRVVFNRKSGVKQCSMRTYLDEESLNLSPIHDPTIDDEMTTAEIVGCCNGVVCLFNDDSGRFFLWNPATRNHTKLPRIERATSNVGFGWDEWSCAFKVFVAVRSNDEEYRLYREEYRLYRGMVYNPETYSWKKTADYEHIDSLCGNGKFASGKVHWITFTRDWDCNIEFFDLRREVFGRIELPMQPCKLGFCFYPWMWETRGCLGFICEVADDERRRRVWVRKEECWVEVAKEPWVGLISQPVKTIVGCNEGYFWVESLVSPRRRKSKKELSGFLD